ncbi:MAG: anthranilate phosphoribosyltransferase [Xanthomonadales bacterium]|nr:anthranilate phosphoribosyltransferase [Xanthomonadales bacterium]
MDIREALGLIAERKDLTTKQMRTVMKQIMTGGADNAQIGAFLMGMRLKGETIDEITGAVMVMRELATGVQVSGDHLVDIVGTGGDGANLFNVSTATAFVVAAAGGRVAKHGNRSVSSKSGSADLLEAAGVKLDISPEQVASCVEELGVGFMFAPAHHSAMKHAIGPRKELAMRTIFNILGPMTNPAGVRRMLIGVFAPGLCRPVAEVLGRLGAEHVLVVHSDDGLDEISIAGDTRVAEFRDQKLEEFTVHPADFGLEAQALDGLEVADATASLDLIRRALNGDDSEQASRAADIIALNAGAALYVAGVSDSIAEGVTAAGKVIASGEAWHRLQQLAEKTSAF